jgi:hypothetical protein
MSVRKKKIKVGIKPMPVETNTEISAIPQLALLISSHWPFIPVEICGAV